jgi:hypothetical protein
MNICGLLHNRVLAVDVVVALVDEPLVVLSRAFTREMYIRRQFRRDPKRETTE